MPIWCLFDLINFYGVRGTGMRAWVYIGLPIDFSDKFIPYLLAFGSIVPGMLMSGQAMLNAGWFDWARTRPDRLPRWLPVAGLVAGVAMSVWPLVHPDPVTNLTLWTSLVFLLDPINDRLGRPSMFRDWRNGWYGRSLAAMAGGLACGLLWEFWNYWALTKWTYHLPFLGRWGNRFHYFEMPLPGLIGFLRSGWSAGSCGRRSAFRWTAWPSRCRTSGRCSDGRCHGLPARGRGTPRRSAVRRR